MNVKSLTIPIYDWNVIVCYNIQKEDKDELVNRLGVFNIPKDVIESSTCELNDVNSGTSITNSNYLFAVILYTQIYDESGFWKIIPHEIDHLVTRIAEYHNLEIEARGYLTGYIYRELYKMGVIDEIKSNLTSQNILNNECESTDGL